MNDEVKPTEETASKSTGLTPGKLLKAARKTSGKEYAQMASATNLSEETIRNIENDDYTGIAGVTYIRGYLRLLAQQVGANTDEVFAAFDRLHVEEPEPMIEEPWEKEERVRKPVWVKLFTVCIALVLITGVFFWWRAQHMTISDIKEFQVSMSETNSHSDVTDEDVQAIKAAANEGHETLVPTKKPVLADNINELDKGRAQHG